MSRFTSNPAELVAATTGTPAPEAALGYYTLANSTTYYAEVGDETAPWISLHLQWDATITATITFEGCDVGDRVVRLISTTSGDWLQENPSTAVVPITGTGASVSNMTITLAGGGVGGATLNLVDIAHRRLRVKVVVTTGGALRIAQHAKRNR